MHTITYIRKIPFFKRFFGITLLIFGTLIILFGDILFGFIAVAFGIYLNLSEGTQIDLESKTYRKLTSILGVKFGQWTPCPNFEYVSVFKTKESQRINVVTATTLLTNNIILVNLFYEGNKNITFYKTDTKEDAFEIADHFKLAFGIDVLDATTNDRKWL